MTNRLCMFVCQFPHESPSFFFSFIVHLFLLPPCIHLCRDPDGTLTLSNQQKAKFGAWKRPSQIMNCPKMIAMISSSTIRQVINSLLVGLYLFYTFSFIYLLILDLYSWCKIRILSLIVHSWLLFAFVQLTKENIKNKYV